MGSSEDTSGSSFVNALAEAAIASTMSPAAGAAIAVAGAAHTAITRFNSSTNRMHRMNPTNQVAQRSGMKVTGRKNVKSVVGKQHKVHVSKSLREKVKKVIEGQKCYGTYTATRVGAWALQRGSGVSNDYPNTAIGAYAVARQYGRIGTNAANSNSRGWVATLLSGDGFLQGDDMNYFTPLKVLDAASVLWNNKAMARDYTLQTGNFKINTNKATGVPVGGAPAAPLAQGQKIHVINSWVKFEIKNVSQRSLEFNIYNCVPKVAAPDRLPFDTFIEGLNVFIDTAAGSNQFKVLNDNLDLAVGDPNFAPSLVDPFNSTYKYTKMDHVLAPGETCVHYVSGPKNVWYDFSKMYESAVDQGGKLNKHSVGVFVSIKPDLVFATVGVNGSASGSGAGRFWPSNATPATFQNTDLDPLAVEVTEVFKLSMPDDTGFYQQAVTAGAAKSLNLRRPYKAFANFVYGDVPATLAYQRVDEENPTLQISEGKFQ